MTIYVKTDSDNRVVEYADVLNGDTLEYATFTLVTNVPASFKIGEAYDWKYVAGNWTHNVAVILISLEVLRIQRDKLLAESDWTQGRDVILANDLAWTVYRTALRDITGGYTPVAEPVWPEEPS